MIRAVFLDRDGVLNRASIMDGRPYPPSSVATLEILPGVAKALEQLKAAGFLLLVVTNQPDVARGRQSRGVVERLHEELLRRLPLDEVFVCYHDDPDECPCRKPRPGLLLDAAKKYGISLEASFLVGDRWRDIEAGQRAGVRTLWVDRGYKERQPQDPPTATVSGLPEAADWIQSELAR